MGEWEGGRQGGREGMRGGGREGTDDERGREGGEKGRRGRGGGTEKGGLLITQEFHTVLSTFYSNS